MFTETDAMNLPGNAIQLIGKDWMLITAGNVAHCNTMTAAWGGLGYLWNRPVAYIFIRPQRYTFTFVEQQEMFSLCFFDEKFRSALNYLGTVSGRDEDKISKAGLTPLSMKDTIYFDEAKLVLICRKIYQQDIDPVHFLDPDIQKVYPGNDYHRMYIGEIVNTLVWTDQN